MAQYTYKFTFKKDDIFLEYLTTDKDSIARQFQIWVTCASIYTYNKDKVQQQQEAEKIVRVNPEIITPEVKLDDIQIQDRKQEIADVVYQAGEVGDTLDDLYSEKLTINSLQPNLSTETDELEATLEEFSPRSDDFDTILEQSLTNPTFEPESKKDDRFLKILSVKNVSEKLEYLIVTAYYLSEFEKLDKFTLKQINAKLMQNIETVVDHGILQEAINKNLVETLPNLPEIQSSAEYRLTTLGEEAFLNGTNIA